MKFVHFGIPTKDEKKWVGGIDELKVQFNNPSEDAFGIEWLKFADDSPMHEMIRTKPHVAFEVDDLDDALKGKKVLCQPFSPMPGFRFAFIDHEGAVIELCESKPVPTCGCGCNH